MSQKLCFAILFTLYLLLHCEIVSSCPVINLSDYLTGLPKGVIVSNEDNHLVFDDYGNFQYELPIHSMIRFLGMSHGGLLWAIDRNYQANQTTISKFTASGTLIREFVLKGAWNAFLREDVLYVAERSRSAVVHIQVLDEESSTTIHYKSLTASAEIHDWVIGDNGIICTNGSSEELAIVSCFGSDEKLLWSHQYELSLALFTSITIDRDNNVYVSGTVTENSEVSLLQFSAHGILKNQIRVGNTMFAFAVSGSGNIFVGDIDKFVYRHDSSGKYQESWDASDLDESETWQSRRDKERRTRYIDEFSSDEELLNAALHGSFSVSEKAKRYLLAKGSQIIPLVISKYVSSEGRAEFLFDAFLDEFHEEVISEIARRFAAATRLEKERVYFYLVIAQKGDVPGLDEFLREKLQSEDPYEQEQAKKDLVEIGKDTQALNDFWTSYQNGDFWIEELTYYFSFNLPQAMEILGPAILSGDKAARKILIEAMTWNLESNHNALSEIANEKINSWETSRMTEVLPMISLLKLKHGDLTELRPSLEYARNDLELAPIVLNIAADEMLQSSQVLLDLGPEIFELIDKVMLKDDCSGLAFNSNSVFEKLMQIPYFRDRVIAQALSYSFSNQSTEISEKVLSKYLGPELISSHVIVESLSLPVSAYEKYWNSLDLISRRFELLRPQIRNLILPHLNSSSRHLSNALVLLRKVGTIQDSQAVMNLMTEASSSRNDCTFHEGFKTLGILGGSSQFVDWIWQYVEVEPTLVAAALSKTAFPDALPILLKAAGEISHYRPAKLNGSMFIPYGIEAEKALLKKLELLNGKGRQEILILLSEMGSSKGHQVVRQEFENSVHEGQFPPTGVVSALMIYGEDPWAELLNRLVDVNDGCNENMLKWFPETLKIKAAKRIGELMLQENDRIRFKKLQYWLNTDAFDEDQDYISEWVRLNHSNPKMRKLVIGR